MRHDGAATASPQLHSRAECGRDRQTRLSLVWEYTPLAFVQLRVGLRNYDDVQEVAFFNKRIVFLQLHGYL